jgi:hypothetical protein
MRSSKTYREFKALIEDVKCLTYTWGYNDYVRYDYWKIEGTEYFLALITIEDAKPIYDGLIHDIKVSNGDINDLRNNVDCVANELKELPQELQDLFVFNIDFFRDFMGEE